MSFKLIVAGSRNFSDYEYVKKFLDYYLSNKTDVEIVSGHCRGVDDCGERYAKEKGYELKCFPANWSLGKKAGPVRNRQMAEYADGLVVFWDGQSKGTKSMIEIAKIIPKLSVKIVRIDL